MIVQIRLSEVQLAPGLLVQGLLKYTYNIHTPIPSEFSVKLECGR